MQKEPNEAERKAQEGIDFLLGIGNEKLIAMIDDQYMLYGPMNTPKSLEPRLQQLLRVLLEFTIGLPKKLINYWMSGVVVMNKHSPRAPLTFSVVSIGFSFFLAIPYAIWRFALGFCVAMYRAVLKPERDMVFLPKRDLFMLMRGEV